MKRESPGQVILFYLASIYGCLFLCIVLPNCRVYGIDALAKTSGFIKRRSEAQRGSPSTQQEM